MDVEQNPLLQLEPDKQQQLVDLVQNGDVEAVANATGMSRRSVILAAAALGVGTIGGGVTAQELIQEAQAAASTTDGDGNVGTPQNPVDLFADGVDANSVNTDGADISGNTALRDVGDSSISVSFDTWTTLDADRPAWLTIDVFAATDGVDDGFIEIEVDKSGGTTADYTLAVTNPAAEGGDGFSSSNTASIYVPAGGQFRVVNSSDPKGSNLIRSARKIVQ